MRVGTLWIREFVEHNVTNAPEKFVPAATLGAHLDAMGFEFRDGRAVSSLHPVVLSHFCDRFCVGRSRT